MNIPDRLPNPPKYEGSLCQKMTEEDWIEYFANREKYDKAMSETEKKEILADLQKVDYLLYGKLKEAKVLAKKIPMKPYLAFCLKSTGGLKLLSTFNLYEAKLEYPNEF